MRINSILVSVFLAHSFSATSGFADEFSKNRENFFEHVRKNPATEGAIWLEMQNAMNEWEKVILVFGFADPGDFTACESIKGFASMQNPGRGYRCNPVK